MTTPYHFYHRPVSTPYGSGYPIWDEEPATATKRHVCGYLVNLGTVTRPVWAAYDTQGREVLDKAARTRTAALQGLADALAVRTEKRRHQ